MAIVFVKENRMSPDTEWHELGPIVQLHLQVGKIKTGDGALEIYTPFDNLKQVNALRLGDGGVSGSPDAEGELLDIHHRDHPESRFRGANGISIGFTAHYDKMRERFGDHLTDGIAAESVLVEARRRITLDDLAGGIRITGNDGREVVIPTWEVAHPCSPFSKFCLQYPEGKKPDRQVTEALRFLEDGTRGFNGSWGDDAIGAEIHIGDTVWIA